MSELAFELRQREIKSRNARFFEFFWKGLINIYCLEFMGYLRDQSSNPLAHSKTDFDEDELHEVRKLTISKAKIVKNILGVAALLASHYAAAQVAVCESIEIDQLIAGPKFGAMVKVNDANCGGRGGYLCLDSNAETMSQQESDRMYSAVLAFYMAKQQVRIEVDPAVTAQACPSGYPVIYSIRGL